MSDYIQSLVEKHSTHGLVVDTNVLLLYLIGGLDPDYISKFKRTQTFTREDYEILRIILPEFRRIITTPNILTEVNSLSNQLPETKKLGGYADLFAALVRSVTETYIKSGDSVQLPEFKKYGLTDVGILELGRQGYLILTVDFRLSQYSESQGIDVINFNHLRQYLL